MDGGHIGGYDEAEGLFLLLDLGLHALDHLRNHLLHSQGTTQKLNMPCSNSGDVNRSSTRFVRRSALVLTP